MRTLHLSLLSLAIILGGFGFNASQADVYHDHVHYHHGHTHDGHVIHAGTIQGFEVLEYAVEAHANEKMVVNLKTNNSNNYFNIKGPKSDTPIFMGETFGDQYSAIAPADGTYTIQVFMQPTAAKQNQTARYTLDVKVKTIE